MFRITTVSLFLMVFCHVCLSNTILIHGEVEENGSVSRFKNVEIKGPGVDTTVTTDTLGKFSLNIRKPLTHALFSFRISDCNNEPISKKVPYISGQRVISVDLESCPPARFAHVKGKVLGDSLPLSNIEFELSTFEDFRTSRKIRTNQDGEFFSSVKLQTRHPGFMYTKLITCDGHIVVGIVDYSPNDTVNLNLKYCSHERLIQVKGRVTKGGISFSKNKVRIELFRIDLSNHKLSKVSEVLNGDNGTYIIQAPSGGQYLVKATPLFYSSKALPQYFGWGNTWDRGEVLKIENQTVIFKNIYLPQQVGSSGVEAINGNISFDAEFLGSHDPSDYSVVLLDENLVPLTYDLVSDNGSFSFPSLKAGGYYLSVDIIGIPPSPIYVEVGGEFKQETKLMVSNAGIGLNAFTSIDENGALMHEELSSMKLFPNPCAESLHISSEIEVSQIRIINSSGICVIEREVSGYLIKTETEGLMSGVYFIEIQTSRGIERSKFLKQ